ncbi:phage tail protein [Martelella limonii]|uniref:phage tail protein n=1 Tax=Martelella limonii TaxID=1647649 RepID=UPI001580DF18|nr:phage tail protein [Martelella limonii]
MKKSILWFATSSYLAMAVPAHAEIISISNAIFSFLYSAGVAGAVANAVANVLPYVVLGATVLAGSLGRGRSGALKGNDVKNTFSNNETAVIEAGGRVRIGGLKAFGNTDGSTRWREICHLQGPIDGVEEYWLAGKEVVVDSDTGLVQSPPWSKPGGSWATWQTKIGDGTEIAWPALVSAFPGIWTANHRNRGIFQSLLTFYNPGIDDDKFLTLYQGEFDKAEVVVRASPIYDPRDGAQSAENEATWQWSDNGPLYVMHMMRRLPEYFSASLWDMTRMQASANAADVLVSTKTGTEKRSRFWGIWEHSGTRGETLNDALESIGGELRKTDQGLYYIALIDDDPASEVDFSSAEDYCIDVTEKLGPDAAERPNKCVVKYYAPEMDYELTQVDMTGIAWANVTAEINKYGPKEFTVDLPFCPSVSQACRIARRLFYLQRASTVSMTTNMVGLAAWNKHYATIILPDEDTATKLRISAPQVSDADGVVKLSGKVWPALSPFNPATDEADPPEDRPQIGFTSSIDAPSAPTAFAQVQYPSGGYEMRLQYAAVGYDGAEANYRSYTGGNPNPWQAMTESGGATGTLSYVSGDFTGQVLDGRVRAIDGESASSFSPIFNGIVAVNNTLPGIPTITDSNNTGPGESHFVTVQAPAEISVVAIRITAPLFIDRTTECRPGDAVTFSNFAGDEGKTFSIFALTSDGTPGPSTTFNT